MQKGIHKKLILLGISAIVVSLIAGATFYIFDGIKYPQPHGEYEVGRTKFFLTDEARLETFSDDASDKRELPVTVYYPATPQKGDQRSTFASKAVGEGIAAKNGFPAVILDTIHPNSFVDARPTANETFPVLLFSGGLYGQFPFYGSLLEAVASEGYIIVCVEHPYSEVFTETSDGRLIPYSDAGTAYFDIETDNSKLEAYSEALADVWTADMLFIYDNLGALNATHKILAGTMNLEKTGIFGHSFGGAAAVQCLQEREELIAGINMDGSLFGKQKVNPVKQPVVFMNSSQGAVQGAICFEEKIVSSMSSEACYHMMLLDSTHDSFAPDSGLFYDKYPFARPADGAQIDGREALSSLAFYITSFFDQYLLDVPQEFLEVGYSPDHLHMMSSKFKTDMFAATEG